MLSFITIDIERSLQGIHISEDSRLPPVVIVVWFGYILYLSPIYRPCLNTTCHCGCQKRGRREEDYSLAPLSFNIRLFLSILESSFVLFWLFFPFYPALSKYRSRTVRNSRLSRSNQKISFRYPLCIISLSLFEIPSLSL